MEEGVIEIKLTEGHGLPTDLILVEDETPSVVVATSKGYLLRYRVEDWKMMLATRVCKGSIRKVFVRGALGLVAPTDGGLLLGTLGSANIDCKLITAKVVKEESQTADGDGGGTSGPFALGVVNAIVYHPDEDCFYIGTEDGDVHCCRLELANSILRIQHTYDHHDDYISDLYLSLSKKVVLATSGDGTMSVVDIRKKSVVASTKNLGQDITAMAHVAGNKIIIGTSMGVLKEFTWNYWGASSGSAKARLHRNASINKIIGVGDGSFIITAADDGCLRLCSLQPLGDQVRVLLERKDDPVQGLVFVPAAGSGEKKKDTDQEILGNLLFIVSTDASLFVVPFVEMGRASSFELKRTPSARHAALSTDDEEEEVRTSKKRRKKTPPRKDNPFPGLD